MRYKGIKEKCWQKVREIVKKRETDCYTCGAKNLEGKNAQAGHCFPVSHVGSNNTLSWDLRQIHLQCSRCNGAGQGMQKEFLEHLTRDYGHSVVEELLQRRYKVDPVKDWGALLENLTQTAKNMV